MNALPYTAVTSTGEAFDIRFPLHPQTGSEEAVAGMLTSVLDALTRTLADRSDVTDGDVLQALAMALAIRARMVDAKPSASMRLMHELVDGAFAATLDATRYQAARA
ncbi:MAG: hypothetical protein WCA32_20860 [Chromatiaceae bacterium]